MNLSDSAADIVRNLVSPAHLALAEAVKQKTGQSLLLVMLDLELVDDETLAEELSRALRLERFISDAAEWDTAAQFAMDRDFAHDHNCFPVSFEAGRLVVAMVDPLDTATIDEVETVAGYPVRAVVATRRELDRAFSHWPAHPEERGPSDDTVTIGDSPLAIPTVVFVGFPDGVGTTFIIWNLAYLIAKKRKVLLVSIGRPSGDAEDLEPLPAFGAYLTVVNDAALVPDRLLDLAERAEAGGPPRFDIALAEIDRPTFVVDAEQVAQWAQIVILITDTEHAGESWELIRSMFAGGVHRPDVSVGLLINKSLSPEHGEVGQATAEAAARASDLDGSVRVWVAGILPFAPEAVHRAEEERRLVVEALPRDPFTRELKDVARRLIEEAAKAG
ncbi:hypothetical protein JXA88_01950 [Candidatus Fermentibacteria bacterium]|nr:hypothetical protein [Candidatus Fermentibacteria bacterium]